MTSVSSLSNGLTPGTGSSLSNALSGSSSTTAGSNLTNTLSGTNNNSASTAIGDSTSEALQQISDAIAALGAQATGDAQEFEKTTQDVLYDNNVTGRAIGQLRLNSTRLNVISAISPKDTADVFTFNVSSSGTTKLNVLVNDPNATDQTKDASGNLRVQIFAKGKGVVADSDPGAGDAYQNYLALKKGSLDLAGGRYSIRVSRAAGIDTEAKNTYNYALQLSQGTKYTQDYTVTEQGYTAGTDDPFGLGSNTNSPISILSDSLADSYSNIASLSPIGTTGTSKLLGFIYSSSS
jgi:hypothetical protein